MRLVIDANRIFAALIRDSTTRKMLVEKEFNLYVPQFVLEEITKHINELEEKTGLGRSVLKKKIEELIILSEIKVIPPVEIKPFVEEAKKISPDPDDVEYVPLALKMNCPIWSDDKELKVIKKIKIFNTKELIKEQFSDLTAFKSVITKSKLKQKDVSKIATKTSASLHKKYKEKFPGLK